MSRLDAMLARRMIFSSLLGAIIGWERRAVDRPAGMRTMSLVCMGACLFTITSIFGFLDGPMNWDASRVQASSEVILAHDQYSGFIRNLSKITNNLLYSSDN